MKYELGDLVAHNHEDVDSLGTIYEVTETCVKVFFFKWKLVNKGNSASFSRWIDEESMRECPYMPYYIDGNAHQSVDDFPDGKGLRIIQKVEK